MVAEVLKKKKKVKKVEKKEKKKSEKSNSRVFIDFRVIRNRSVFKSRTYCRVSHVTEKAIQKNKKQNEKRTMQ